jgi:transcription-repair coupling factor (superfamily II helicase)
VLAGKQVAVLVPTTVLAAQHFATFRERMAGYPVRIEMLSRFRTDAEADAIGEGLGEGKVDIVIGTHRLLSPGISFKDLGLVVIDEEQRFGVEHKERFKALRATVDVLTLTATPIPRTLNMALLGLKDISTLTTPPEGRMPVATEVSAFDERKIRDYIVRELRRGGQVYFVHNRIETIHTIDRLVATLVPEARRAVVHGRMPRHALEDSMMAFVRGEIDVLVATTIVESGLDIPNANTLIVDRAHRIGLADLHQLRGRVGRGRHRGHALFLLPEEHKVTDEVAERRLRTIEEHAGLGAGFRIALKDLEIRGAGNLLGAEQSGYIADVGYELYCRLLEDAVKGLRNERVTEATDTYVDLHVAAGLPDEYAGDASGELLGLKAEIEDRCGPLPEPGARLFDVARLRVIGQEHGIARFAMEKGGVLQMTILDPARALPFLRSKLGRSLRQPQEGTAIVAEPQKPADPARALARFLELLGRT